jgi:U3 small nucleolar RNA-associated protein 4
MENHRTLSNLPQNPPLQSAVQARMIVSWWDREIHVWRLQKPLKEIVDFAGVDSDATKNRKLLARILIKGEANITSATISNDGSLLLVSTTSDIKAFHLKSKSEARKDELKISKVDVPVEFAARGATDLKISPDGKWVCASQEGSKISLLQVSQDADEERPVIHSKAVRLNRLRRNIPKRVALGGLGQYDRSITQIAFSADTRMLAVADMAGYIDTWILRDSKPAQNGTGSDLEDEDSSSDNSDDEEDADAVSSGPFWLRNPNGALLPKLYSAPTVLSFSEHVPTENQPGTASDDDEITDDYVLLAITAKTQILTIHPRSGSITPWSRRNPVQRFPVEFRNIRDLVKGVLWAGDRFWLYGNTFVVMIDMSKDIAEDVINPSSALVPVDDQQQRPKKRKRGADTGAGNKMQVGSAGPTKVEYYAGGEGVEELDLDGADAMDTDATSVPDDDSESDDSEEELQGELVSRRRAEGQKDSEGTESQGIGFWHTLKYRPILGIVPLQEGVREQGADNDVMTPYMNGQVRKTLEVALVERPLWETDMADRYFADGEFER